MLILSQGSIRGCGNAKVVKAMVVMVTALHGEGPCTESFWRVGVRGIALC